ncbi:MAG: FAD-dependent monooxygenase, partial [Pseudomonadota bacterium]
MTRVVRSALLPTPELTTSVCVVGGGPAGIILARELAAQGV